MAGSNDLNLLLKAQVVKLKVELDAKGSKLPQQVNNISKMLANNPVKLKVKLDAKIGDLNKQLKEISGVLQKSKSFKPVKVGVEIDVKGSATNIKKQLQDIYKTVGDFNKKYGEQVKRMQEQMNKASSVQKDSQGKLNVPVGKATVGNFNNIKDYVKQVKEAENILRSKFKEEGNIFKTTQFKDAEGNLRSFVAEMQRTNGIVEKIKYGWNNDKQKFEVIDRQTVDTTNKHAKQISDSLKALKTDINNLKKTDGKGSILSQYREIKNLGGDATKEMVAGLKNAIEVEQKLQQATKARLSALQKEEKLLYDLRKARSEATGKNASGLNDLVNKAEGIHKKDNSALEIQKIRLEMQKFIDNQSKSNAQQKESNNILKETIQLRQKLREVLRSMPTDTSDNKLKRSMVTEAIEATRAIKTYEQLAQAKKNLQNISNNKWMDSDQTKAKKLVDDLKSVQRQLNEIGKNNRKLDSQINFIDDRMKNKLLLNTQDIRNALSQYTRMLKDEKQKISNAEKQIRLGQDISGKFDSGKVREMENILFKGGSKTQQDIQNLYKYIGAMEKAKVASISFGRDSTDAMGKVVKTMNVVFEGKGDHVRKATYNMTQGMNQIRIASDEMIRNVNRNLSMMERFKTFMKSAPVWMLSQEMFYAPINGMRLMVEEILKVDKALTELRRVANEDVNVDILFENAVGLASELGNNIHDVTNAMSEFARTFGDFNERQLTAITRTATLMSNVSDLSAQDAQKALVGTMNAFNIKAEESIRIVDAMNEVKVYQPPLAVM